MSLVVELNIGIRSFHFDDEADVAVAMRLAAEALLVFGSNFNGLEKPDGYNSVELEGAELRLSDFGIPGVA